MRVHRIVRLIALIFPLVIIFSAPGFSAPGLGGIADSVRGSGLVVKVQARPITAVDKKRISLALKRLADLRKKFGAKHPKVAEAMYALGVLYERTGRFSQATVYYRGASNIWRAAFGANHPLTRKANIRVAALAKRLQTKPKILPRMAPKKPTTMAKKLPQKPIKRSFNYEAPPKAPSSSNKSLDIGKSVKRKAEKKITMQKPGAAMKKRQYAPKSTQQQPQQKSVQKYSYQRRSNEAPVAKRSMRAPEAPAAPPPNAMTRSAESTEEAMEMAEDSGEAASDDPFTTVRVFYATDRNNTGSDKPAGVYGVERSELQYGFCDVSIPKDHRVGEIERPSYWTLDFWENEERHVVLRKVLPQQKSTFFANLRSRVANSQDASAFLFVHGYNTTFERAAHRTAQMTFDLGFEGAPVFYSWPSQGTTSGYTVDENNIRWTEPHLKNFIADFVKKSDAQKIFLVAHSMGSRALTHAVSDLARDDPSVKDKIEAIILAAPDIDADVFKNDIMPRMSGAAKSMTLYVSKNDKALLASKHVHGYPRAGDAGASLIVTEGLDTIDASEVDTSLFGHAYFAEEKSIIDDLIAILKEGRRAAERSTLLPVDSLNGTYWKIRTDP